MSCTACQQRRFYGFTEDAQAAMTANPEYFRRWEGWKTAALLVTLLALAYQASK